MKATRTGTLISEESKINAMLADQTLIYLGYQKALKAVQVNGTSMVVIDTICALLVDARDKRGALLKMKKEKIPGALTFEDHYNLWLQENHETKEAWPYERWINEYCFKDFKEVQS